VEEKVFATIGDEEDPGPLKDRYGEPERGE
jgi:hypothetical protein